MNYYENIDPEIGDYELVCDISQDIGRIIQCLDRQIVKNKRDYTISDYLPTLRWQLTKVGRKTNKHISKAFALYEKDERELNELEDE